MPKNLNVKTETGYMTISQILELVAVLRGKGELIGTRNRTSLEACCRALDIQLTRFADNPRAPYYILKTDVERMILRWKEIDARGKRKTVNPLEEKLSTLPQSSS